MVAVADAGVDDGVAQERGQTRYGDALEHHLAAVVALVFQVDGAGFQVLAEGFEVGVGADDLDAVLREDAVVRLGNVDPEAAAEDGHDMDAEAVAQVQFRQGLAAPVDFGGNVEVGEVHVLGQQAGGVFRFLLTQVFGAELAGAEVRQEGVLDALRVPLDEAAGDDGEDHQEGQDEDQQDRDVEQAGQDVEDETQGQRIPQHDGRHERRPVRAAFLPEGLEGVRVAVLDHHRAQERRQGDQGDGARDDVRPRRRNPFRGERHQQAEGEAVDGDAQDAVYEDDLEDGSEVLPPFALLARGRGGGRGCVIVHEGAHASRKVLVHEPIRRFRQPDHVWRQEDRDDRNGHDDRVQETARHAQGHAQGGDDEGEFADLRQREAALHRGLQGLSGQEHARGGEEKLPDDDGEGDDHDGQPVLGDHRRVHHHPHGHEEDGAEQVLHRLDEAFDVFRLDGFRQDGAHDEGAEGGGEAGLGGEDDHAEAQAQGHHEERLVVHQLLRPAQQERDQVDAHDDPQDEEERQFADRHHQFPALEVVGDRHRGQDHHQDDGEDVLQDEDGHHQARELLLGEPEVLEGLVDDGCGRHGDHAAQEQGVHLAPAETGADGEPQENHAEDDGQGRDDGRSAHLHDLLETEFQAEGEQEEDHADVRPGVDAGRVDDRGRQGEMGAGDEAGHDVAQHKRLLELLEDQGHDTRADQDQRQVGDQRFYF